ncbi:MAG TPA: LytTR family DNA-binding domain-containing protein [Candidatus Saccharimonadales bacterium]|nr:LytTR family DNA-binding domain-containing protein [Candidatus Saccharimonadales bacterium]
MKLRAYLVDDEPLALARLRRLLLETGRVEIVGATTEPEEAVAALAANPPDLCFLDIHMPRLSGFDVLAKLPTQPLVVFTTAYDGYALKAFAVNSVDYLLKPIDPQQLERALAKVENLRRSPVSAAADIGALLERLTKTLAQPKTEYPERIASRLGTRLCFLDLAKVTHFYAEDKLTFAFLEGQSFCVDHTIAELENTLNPKQFLRIHRATLVNLAWVKEISPLPGGSLNLRLKDAAKSNVTVARDRASEFKSRAGF